VSFEFALCDLVEIAIAFSFSQMRRWKEPDNAKNDTLGSDEFLAPPSNRRNRK